MTRPRHTAPPQRLRFVAVAFDDARAQPLLDELAVEYAQRYDSTPPTIMSWLTSVPVGEFAPPDGGFLIGELDGTPVTGARSSDSTPRQRS